MKLLPSTAILLTAPLSILGCDLITGLNTVEALSGDSSGSSNGGQGGVGGGGQGGFNSGGQGGTDNTGGTSNTGGSGNTGGMGEACLNNEDCSDVNAVCDPQQAICDRNFQCNAVNDCGAGETCFDQAPGGQHGACYTSCQPFGPGCSAGQTCVDHENYGQSGVCMQDGTAGHSQSCTLHDISTGCIAGHACYSDSGNNTFCLELCNFWGNGVCTAGNELCFHFGACAPLGVDPAAIGSSCNGSNQGTACGLVGEVATGICNGSPPICQKWCRLGGSDCTAGSCTPLFSNLGICIGA